MSDTQEISVPSVDKLSGTVGDDVMTVHMLTNGRPICGASGEVDEWQRRATCPACLTAD